MAKYKNREVEIIKDMPNALGDQVLIQHKEQGLGQEIVAKKEVVVSAEEKKHFEEDTADKSNDFKVELTEIKKDSHVLGKKK